ncbi:diiron oxygenase [Nitriliruptoraceae bacterium ZYF776]|nr:diiron oxygenase [Profundirhabdus halotolerans]
MRPRADPPEQDARARYERKVDRLSDLSGANPHDAYEDVPWDEPGFELDPTDPRLRLFSFDPLARTRWYHQLEPIEQARVGLRRQGVNLRIGWEFENYLQQGLLARALRMDNTDVAFRYHQYEVAEESHHSMMFYEFVRRYAPEVRGMPGALKTLTNPTVQVACRRYPALFFFLVLGGEVPIDHVQRLVLKEEQVHPLLERIMRIHVEEEARHVGFANLELRRLVPRMTDQGRRVLARLVPETLGIEARLMLYPSPWQVRHEQVPKAQLKAAYRHPETHRLRTESVARIRKLCDELGLLTPEAQRHWERVGLWAEPKRRAA